MILISIKKILKQNFYWLILAITTLSCLIIVGGFLVQEQVWKIAEIRQINPFGLSSEFSCNRLLDGLIIDEQEEVVPWAVIIENSWDAWPVSGIDKASIVYEALAESGIPRFLAFFYPQENILEIGPVRSARSYFIDWAEAYNPLFVHAGGSPQALSRLRLGGNFINLDEIGIDSRYFYRDIERNAPHNLYTSSDLLSKAVEKKSNLKQNFIPDTWQFKDDLSIFERPKQVEDLIVDFSTYAYQAVYKYDRALNDYLRFQGDKVQLTRQAQEIRVKNIMIIYVPTFLIDSLRLGMKTAGSGKALICLDGACQEGKWQKDSVVKREKFFYADKSEVRLNRGLTFIEILPLQ